MRILHVTVTMDPRMGGVSQAIRNIIKGLASTPEHSNEVLSLDVPDSDFAGIDFFPVHAVGPAKTPWSYSSDFFPWLIKNITRFDTVIIHGLWLYPSHAVQKAMTDGRQPSKSSVRYYVMPHGMLDPYFQRDPSRRLKAIRNWFYWKLIENKVVNKSSGLLFTCEEEKLLAREPFRPYHPRQELVVGLGVEEPPAYRAEMKTSFALACASLEDRSYLLFLSRIHPKKGVDILIQSYVDLLKSPGGDPTHLPSLVIAGPLDSEYAEKMQRLAAELLPPSTDSAQPRILFPGMLQGDAKWGAFYGCDAFILPSHQENFGIAVVESLASGKPVIISDKVNIWREIAGMKAGIVNSDSLEGTRKGLKEWLEMPAAARKEMSEAAVECYRQHYQVEQAASTMVRALEASANSI